MKRSEFLATVEDFLQRTNMSPTAFGIKAKAEPNFVFSLREGRECREEVQDRVLRYMANFDAASAGTGGE